MTSVRPDSSGADPTAALTKSERFNVRLVEMWHTVPMLTSLSNWAARNIARREFELILHNVIQDHYFEKLRSANYDNGLLVCANHRSFVDNFAVAIRAMNYIPKDVRLIAPARTEGLFDRPWGIFLNLLLTSMNMYPPIIRSSRGTVWGKRVAQILSDLLLRG